MQVLGFQPMPRPAFPFPGAWLAAGDLTLHLIAADPTAPALLNDWQGLWRAQESLMRAPASRPEPWWLRRARHLAFHVGVGRAAAGARARGGGREQGRAGGAQQWLQRGRGCRVGLSMRGGAAAALH